MFISSSFLLSMIFFCGLHLFIEERKRARAEAVRRAESEAAFDRQLWWENRQRERDQKYMERMKKERENAKPVIAPTRAEEIIKDYFDNQLRQ